MLKSSADAKMCTSFLKLGLTVITALVAAPFGCAKPADQAGAMPRYQLQVGQELVYEGQKSLSYSGQSSHSKATWSITVVRQNQDGSWRLVFATSERSFDPSAAKNEKEEAPGEVSLAYCDLFPDGRITENSTVGLNFNPREIFPRLPNDAASAAKGWEERLEATDITTRYRLDPRTQADAGRWVIEAENTSPIDQVYLSTSKALYSMASSSGVPERIDTENSQSWGIDAKGDGTMSLKSAELKDAKTAEAFGRDMDIYFQAAESSTALVHKAMAKPQQAESLLTEATGILKAAVDKVTVPSIKENLAGTLEGLGAAIPDIIQSANRRPTMVGQAAASWEADDLDGRKHSLEQYRGKVVVLDFWFRGCSWCIRGMGDMKRLADGFKDQPVAILGMNTDEDVEDARFVVEKLGLNYPNLRAQGIPEKYEVTGFPMLVIIDQAGKIHDVHTGFSATMYEDISAEIKELLKGGS